MSQYAEVAVFSTGRLTEGAQTFTYSVPAEMAGRVQPGSLVVVPFHGRKLSGVVTALAGKTSLKEIKSIDSVLDPEPVLDKARLELAGWIASEWLAPLSEAIRLFLPPGITVHSAAAYALAPWDGPLPPVDNLQAEIIELVRQRGSLTRAQIERQFKRRQWDRALQSLVRRGILTSTQIMPRPAVRPRRVQYARATGKQPVGSLGRNLATATRRSRALDYLRGQTEPVWVSWVYAESGCSLPDLQVLEEMGLIELVEGELLRDPLADHDYVPTQAPPLTPDQAAVCQAIQEGIEATLVERDDLPGDPVISATPHPVYLLHGVTGSGKTEIYMRAVDETIRRGRQAIVLVPEISLTPQTIRRFAARFPGRVTVMHSRLPEGERYDTWRQVRAGKMDVVVGARSALLAPLPRLGLIVLDEEHETSYKQDVEESTAGAAPYHARDVAIHLGKLVGAPVILGSATPSLESHLRAQRGEFKRLELAQRIFGHERRLHDQQVRWGVPHTAYTPAEHEAQGIDMPPVEIVDLRRELHEGNRHIFSRSLQGALAQVLERGEQAILFLNRRGAATFVLCRDCGYVVRCPNCDIPLTFHEPLENQAAASAAAPTTQLVCHRCGHRKPPPSTCPSCKGRRIRYFGLGTQKVEAAVAEMFPQAHVLRWDSDTAAVQDSETLLAQFANHQADILIGTQMIAKGLDLPLVTLVGVISADTALYMPDLRSGERTFDLLAQVAGRAGRGLLGGRVILQTYSPDHYAIQAAARHDYAQFAAHELAFRREQNYPPYSRLARLLFRDTDARRVQHVARETATALGSHLEHKGLSLSDLIGPAPCFFTRTRRDYRWQIVLRAADPAAVLRDFSLPPACRVDIDPINLL